MTNALVNVARRARGCRTAGDDRLETRGYAVKRLLHRWSRAQRSARFACSVAQLVQGLAPIMGWGSPPAGRAQRERWVRAHRKSVQRWLDDLQRAGLLVYDGERDNRGQLWRTLITLLPAPDPPHDELQLARRRLRGFKRRGRRRHSYRRRRARARRAHTPLEAILTRSARPQRATRARLARRRACALHERQRRAGVDAQLAATHKEDLTHPFGALTPSETHPVIPDTPVEPAAPLAEPPALESSAQAFTEPEAFAAGTGARTHEPDRRAGSSAAKTVSTENGGAGAPVEDPWEGLEERVAARLAVSAWRRHEAARQALERARTLLVAPAGVAWGLGGLREAWVVFRFGARLRERFDTPESGPERVGDHGAGDAGARRPGQLARAGRAIALYERFAAQRPPGWPAAGAGALCALAAHQRAASLEGDIARLRMLATDMRAAALYADAQRVERARRRAAAARRATPTTPTPPTTTAPAPHVPKRAVRARALGDARAAPPTRPRRAATQRRAPRTQPTRLPRRMAGQRAPRRRAPRATATPTATGCPTG